MLFKQDICPIRLGGAGNLSFSLSYSNILYYTISFFTLSCFSFKCIYATPADLPSPSFDNYYKNKDRILYVIVMNNNIRIVISLFYYISLEYCCRELFKKIMFERFYSNFVFSLNLKQHIFIKVIIICTWCCTWWYPKNKN